MSDYRLYFMDRFSGHIERVSDFEAQDDAGAIAAAQGLGNGSPMELWSRHHKLKRWDASAVEPAIHA